jgi:hypothetical protein
MRHFMHDLVHLIHVSRFERQAHYLPVNDHCGGGKRHQLAVTVSAIHSIATARRDGLNARGRKPGGRFPSRIGEFAERAGINVSAGRKKVESLSAGNARPA